MKITIRILTILMLSGFSLACLGQDEYGGLAKKDYHKLVDDADNYFATEDYREALPLFLKLSKIDPHNTDFLFGIGACYLESAEEKIKAIEYFEECTKDPEVDDEIYYYLGRSYHTNYKFDEAISAFSRFLLSAQENHPYKADAHHYIEMCGYARKLVKDSLHVKIINLGPTVNTPFPEYSPVITADESKLIFTSRREGSTGGMIKEIRDYAEDIYISHKENNVWSQATGIGRSINSVFSDASVGLSADGQKLLVYKDSEDDGNIYISQLIGETYTKPIKMGSNINTKAHEFSASLTPDGNTVYFSSDRKGGYGGKDIYRVQKLSGGDWGFAMNLGDNVNSKYDEDAPFIHPDSKNLYFSSKGHNSMGGYDIFVSNIGNSNYISKPNNIGYPINTTDDDIFFVLSASAKRAYYASAKKGGYGSTDIYMIEMEGDKKIGSIASFSGGQFEEETQAAIVMMRGRVLDEVNKLPVGAFIRLTDLQTSELVGVWNANKADGKFLVILNPGKNYGIHVEAEGYLFHSENIEIPKTQTEFKEINKEILLNPIEAGKSVVLRNVFFDSGVASLRQESHTELDKIYKLLQANPKMVIEIAGHTDSVGSAEINNKLSLNRANSVVEYLIERGIIKDNLVAKGYGETKPVASNDTENGRQLNRRTELKILKTAK